MLPALFRVRIVSVASPVKHETACEDFCLHRAKGKLAKGATTAHVALEVAGGAKV